MLLHMKLCITRATGKEPLGNVAMGFPKKRKKILVLAQSLFVRKLEPDFIST